MKHEPILVSMAEGAKMLGLCRVTLYKLIAEGQIRAVKYGKRTLLPYQSLKDFADRLSEKSPTPAS